MMLQPLVPPLGPAWTLLGPHPENPLAHCLYFAFCISYVYVFLSILYFYFLYFCILYCTSTLLGPHAENPLAQWNHRLLPPARPALTPFFQPQLQMQGVFF